MTIVFWIVFSLVIAALAILAVASGKPDTFKVERKTTIAAPPELIYPHVADLVAWQAWSPWAKKDPAARFEFIGPSSGVGAAFAWDGNKEVGKGRMEIVEASPSSRVRYRLDFEKPFRGTNYAVFDVAQASTAGPAGGTELTWTMTGDANMVTKVMDLLMNMDRMVGRDFEAGLAEIKRLSEAARAE